MSFYRDLGLYLRTLKCYGILSVSYQSEENVLKVTRGDELWALISLCIQQLVVAALLVVVVLYPQTIYPPIHNVTGQIYLFLTYAMSCIIVSIINLYFYFKRAEHTRLMQQLLHFNRDCLKNCRTNRFSELYVLYVVLIVLDWYNHWNGFRHSHLTGITLVVSASVFSVTFMICGIVITFYVCVEIVLENTLRHFNRQLKFLVATGLRSERSRLKFKNILLQRNELLLLCRQEVNRTYGIIIVPITAYMLFSAPSGFFYLISVVLEDKPNSISEYLEALFISLTWNLPLTLLFIIMMASNGVVNEAKRTVRILSRVPRKGTKLERVVEKFLIKNLHPEPVLTGYGFFAVDNRTSYNLFTAALTYMVILVQFRQMETSMKPQNN